MLFVVVICGDSGVFIRFVGRCVVVIGLLGLFNVIRVCR